MVVALLCLFMQVEICLWDATKILRDIGLTPEEFERLRRN
jgi:hypothetical protein